MSDVIKFEQGHRLILRFFVLVLFSGSAVPIGGCFKDPNPQVSADPARWQTMVAGGIEPMLPGDQVAEDRFTQLRPAGAIGTDACIDCHAIQYESYIATTHRRSMRLISAEPSDEPEAFFEDPKSKRAFEVQLSNDSMMHREQVRGRNSETLAINQASMKFEVGSGTHAHSYIFERDGFFVQSPLTWYESVKKWELSPGYDATSHATFDRTVTTACAFCHVGTIRTEGNYVEQFAIDELTIGCERCHGAGGNHVQFHSEDTALAQKSLIDDIVHPKRLSRSLAESICAQCHLQGIVSSSAPGANRWDYRPGEPLSNIVTEFQLSGSESTFRIVGHTEQMHASRCYQNSETLTCTTCHDPHAHGTRQAEQAMPALTASALTASALTAQRNNCVSCHNDAHCKVPLDVRVATQQDDCVRCHMPRRDTNVPHAALHDHRIAVHSKSYLLAKMPVPESVLKLEEPSTELPRLVAINDDSHLPEWQQQRRWSLAMHSLAFGDQLPIQMQSDLAQAQAKLIELYRSGHADPNLLVSLAKDYLAANQTSIAADLARRAIDESKAGEIGYLGAADVLAQLALLDQDNQSATKWYRELARYRRVSGDHIMLAICENNAGNRSAAVTELEIALRIDPTAILAHEVMASVLESDGMSDRANAHRDAIKAIRSAGSLLPQ